MAMMRSIARDMLRGVVAEVGDAKQDTTDLAVALSKVREECRQQQALNRALNEQLAAVGEELAAARGQYESERARSTALHDQLVAVGKELLAARRQQEVQQDPNGSHPLAADARRYRDRDTLILLPRLFSLLAAGDRLVIVDGGAREVDRDCRWRAFPGDRLQFFGFEPDRAEAKRLKCGSIEAGAKVDFYPAGLWGTSGPVEFQHNNIGGGSSILAQNRAVTDRWKFENPTEIALARDIFFPIRTETIDAVSLADWARKTGIDRIEFLKLNVQGAELQILEGSGPVLDNVLGVLIEVAFVESYLERPMFSDIDQFLRRAGFTFFDLLAHHYVGRAASDANAQHLTLVEPKLGQLVSSWGQLVEGHALYFRDPVAEEGPELSAPQVLKLAALAEAFGQIEYAFELLKWLRQRRDVATTKMADDLGRIITEAEASYHHHVKAGVAQRVPH